VKNQDSSGLQSVARRFQHTVKRRTRPRIRGAMLVSSYCGPWRARFRLFKSVFSVKLLMTSMSKPPKRYFHLDRLNEAVRTRPGSSVLHRWLLRSQNALRPFPRLRSSWFATRPEEKHKPLWANQQRHGGLIASRRETRFVVSVALCLLLTFWCTDYSL